ncbi:MAG: LPS export ABC transporter periplasmic protein LptC [Fimbriimonadales bacterium]|nr:LPS export ABC transporter periplasmic protein LptC [Fimbriimonadales bacterium]
MHRIALFLIAILAAGCASKAPTESRAEPERDALHDTPIGIATGTLTIASQDESGQRRWEIQADRADATLRTGDMVSDLDGVRLTLFQSNKPFLTANAEKGLANESDSVFRLTGNVEAKTADGRATLRAGAIGNTSRDGEIEATDGVSAIANGFSIERANSARALFSKLDASDATLRMISVQGQDIWFRSSDGDLTIYGVSSGEVEFLNDNRDARFKLRGTAVKMTWQQHGLTVTGRELDVTAAREGEQYRLRSGTFNGGVRVDMTGLEGGVKWNASATGSSAVYDGSSLELRLTGGVRAISSHPTVRGTLSAPTVAVRFDRDAMNRRNAFEPISISGSGGGIRFEDERSDVLITDLNRVSVAKGSAKESAKIEGEGSPFQLRRPRSGGEETVNISARSFEGEVGPGQENGRQATVLLWLSCRGGIDANIRGLLPIEQRSSGTPQWSVEGNCESLDYQRSNSTMVLRGVSELRGRHPALISGAGTIYSPQVDITFKENTFQPRKIAFSRGGSA